MQEVVRFDASLIKYFYINSNGTVPINMIVELPKYYVSANNEIVLNPTITIRQNRIETKSIQLEPINIGPTEIQLNQKDVQQSISDNNVITIDLCKTLIQSEKKLKKKADTSKICLYYANIINLDASEYPGLDKIFIQFDGTVNKAEYKTFLKLLYPFAPHMTEELHEKIYGEMLSKGTWVSYDEALCLDSTVEIVVQINGKIKDKLVIPADISKEELEKSALENDVIKELIAGKTVVKVIGVPKKLVNIVVK